jgi:hypothetical protein
LLAQGGKANLFFHALNICCFVDVLNPFFPQTQSTQKQYYDEHRLLENKKMQ